MYLYSSCFLFLNCKSAISQVIRRINIELRAVSQILSVTDEDKLPLVFADSAERRQFTLFFQ